MQGQRNFPWSDCPGQEKGAQRGRFVGPKEQHKGRSGSAWSSQQLPSLNNAFVFQRQRGNLKYLSFAFFSLLLQSTLQHFEENNTQVNNTVFFEDEINPRTHPLRL